MIKAHTLVFKDFQTEWYKRWAKELKQSKGHLDNHRPRANKFWQNAIIAQILHERGLLLEGKSGIGFGVGQERLPALFAKYSVKVTATDQNSAAEQAKHWSQYELAEGAHSLNRLGICDADTFGANIQYRSVDMRRIPKSLYGKYDFVWSNCALGHLGSIEAGLDFVEKSLECLRPGGWAVHTTEFNVLSNTKTSTGGDTVIFRAKDIHRLLRRLTAKGYRCEPVSFSFGNTPEDSRISMRPQFGNDYSKIQVNGHLATQGVIIIQKPAKPINKHVQGIKLSRSYVRNVITLKAYRLRNMAVREILKSQGAPLDKIKIAPKRKEIHVKIDCGEKKEVAIDFDNQSSIPLFGIYSRLADSKPILLGTAAPNDRTSEFSDETWIGESRNRAAFDLRLKGGRLADYIQPGQDFSFTFTLNAKNIKPGQYTEKFCIVQELAGWITGSECTLIITAT